MAKNYYLILGISRGASLRDIHDAFRQLAKRFHPDRPGGGDAERFREISEAHQVLADPEKRQGYDRSIERVSRPSSRISPQGVEPLIPKQRRPAQTTQAEPLAATTVEGSPLADPQMVSYLLNDWLDQEWDTLFGGPVAEAPETFEGEVTVEAVDAHRGGVVSVRIPTRRVCPACGGAGGSGFHACHRCYGAGALEREIPLSIQFPPGIRDGERYEMPLDRYGLAGKSLVLRFHVVERLG